MFDNIIYIYIHYTNIIYIYMMDVYIYGCIYIYILHIHNIYIYILCVLIVYGLICFIASEK